MKFGLKKESYEKIKNLISKHEKYDFIIFGSRARGDYKDGSDIDIAVYGDVSDKDKFDILNDFDLLEIPYLLDIVFFNELNKPEFIEAIERDGVKFN